MAEEKDNIKHLFSSKLQSFEPEVPPSVWDGLDSRLSDLPAEVGVAASATASKPALAKRIIAVAAVAAVIIIAVLIVPGGKQLTPIKEINPAMASVDKLGGKKDNITDITLSVNPTSAAIAPPAKVIAHTGVLDNQTNVQPAKQAQGKTDVPQRIREQIQSAFGSDNTTPETGTGMVDREVDKAEKNSPIKNTGEQDRQLLARTNSRKVVVGKTRRASEGFSVGLLANSGLISQDVNENGGKLLFSTADRSQALMSVLEKEDREYDLQHDLPVSFGIKVSKGIAPRLSLETGVVYTYLSSKITSNSNFGIEESQTFHYLGIPLSLNYTFYELGKAKFYATVGGMVQKDIKGRYESQMDGLSVPDYSDSELSTIYYSEPYFIRENIEQSRLQFSAHASVGVSYPVYQKLHLYGSVGGAYYFDAGNKYRTIYSDRKTQLDLNLGIKFDF